MRSRIIHRSLLDHLNRWDARHVLGVADEMDSRGHELDDAAAAKVCSDDIKYMKGIEQKERKLPMPTIQPTRRSE